jgi:hypothetical protein
VYFTLIFVSQLYWFKQNLFPNFDI